jgi:hypothetical protein
VSLSSRQAVVAAIRLTVVVALILVVSAWWLMQKAPDFRVDLRVRLQPNNEVAMPGYVILNYQRRLAWSVSAGQMARFQVVIPGEEAVVRFLEGHLEGLPDVAVRMVRTDGERVELGQFHASEAAWKEHRLKLPASPNEEVELEFLCLDGRGRPGLGSILLSDVVLESEGRPLDETENTVTAYAIGVDLLANVSLDKVHAPGNFETSRLFMPGPACLPLEDGLSRTLHVDEVPPGAELSVVLHAAPIGVDPQIEPGRVIVAADELVLANVSVNPLVKSLGGASPSGELIVSADLSEWVGKPLSVSLELEGGGGLFVGVREVLIRQPEERLRRAFKKEGGLNTLLVIVDGLRPDRLGFEGYDRGHTPVLESLAETGLRYEYAVAPSSWALPSVATLLTGVHPLTHGLGLHPGRTLSPRLSTLAESASWAGYSTACFTSSMVISEETGLSRGYETLFGAPMSPLVMVERAVDWLVEASQFEWFLTLHFDQATAPHEPTMADLNAVTYLPDPALVGRLATLDSRPGVAELIANEIGPQYDAEVAGIDQALGVLLDELEDQGLLENTLVVIVGSHGQEFYEHLGRGQGQTLYDEVLRVPVIVSGPGVLGLMGAPVVEREMIEMDDVTQLVGQLGKLMSAMYLSGQTPPPYGPSDIDQVAHSVLFPYEGQTNQDLEGSRRGGVLLLTDRQTGESTLLDLAPGPGQERDLLLEPQTGPWEEEARALRDAFDDWYRATILEAAARPVPLNQQGTR